MQVVDKYLRDGWNGNQKNKHGTRTSTLNYATKNWTELEESMNDISFAVTNIL